MYFNYGQYSNQVTIWQPSNLTTRPIMSPVQAYILEKEDEQQAILQFLHDLLSALPEVTSKIKYKIPFYYRKSWICYLNPTKNPVGVELAFTRGIELSNEQGLLADRGRKMIRGVIFTSVEEIPVETVMEVLHEALYLDETVPYNFKKLTGG